MTSSQNWIHNSSKPQVEHNQDQLPYKNQEITIRYDLLHHLVSYKD